MALSTENNFKEFHKKLAHLPNEVRNKAINLADGMVAVYGFSKEQALEEAIRRANEFFKKRELELKRKHLSNKLIR